MKRYQIAIVISALKQLENFPSFYGEKIIAAIDHLSANPRPHGCEKLINRKNEYRIRIGVYRVIYSVLMTGFLLK